MSLALLDESSFFPENSHIEESNWPTYGLVSQLDSFQCGYFLGQKLDSSSELVKLTHFFFSVNALVHQ